MGLYFCKHRYFCKPPPPPPPHYTKKPDPIDPEKAAQVRNFYFSKKVTSSLNISSNDTINFEKKTHKRSKSSSKISKNSNSSLRGAGSHVDDISEQRDAAQRVLERKRTTQISPEPFQSESTLLSSVIQDITPTVITPSSPTHYSFPTFLFDNQIEASAPPLLPSTLILPSAPLPDDYVSSGENDIVTSAFIPPPLLLPESSVFAPVGWSPSRLKPEFSTESVYDASGTGAATRRRAEEAEIHAEASKREEREAKREALVLRLELIEAQAALAKVKKESVITSEATLCVVCLDAIKNIAFVPCGHSVCNVCDESLQSRSKTCVCPICRQDITSRLKLF